MKQTKQLANRLREVILNGTWIANTNYKDQLENLDWRLANVKFESFNTISDLAQHMHYYISGITNVFVNNTLEIRDKYSFDFSPIQSQQEWDRFLNQFWNDTAQLANLIEKLPEETLNNEFVDKKYGTFLRNIDGMIEHSYYHLGQIVLIKKILLKN
ncbi:DUF1572 family protein [Winogradskyella psychrotolerans]|uniref:DUF1572 family protein n=1 Tax=Winogradskyella psychrotolerans TaxID=1344585 RepID=UPI001C068A2F|nr:DUF1572 family protein [Winogradskyella psychrotolerans]MBU2921926.1 DUF1572 family protein [Winogradskyella psychrotolerans]